MTPDDAPQQCTALQSTATSIESTACCQRHDIMWQGMVFDSGGCSTAAAPVYGLGEVLSLLAGLSLASRRRLPRMAGRVLEGPL